MNSLTTNTAVAIAACLGIWGLPAAAGDPATTHWEAETYDLDRFAGSVSVIEEGETRSLSYSFVFDTQIISTNHPRTAPMEALGADCWRADITGDFLQGIAETMEILFCERGEFAYWTMLDDRGGAVRLPNWVRFSK